MENLQLVRRGVIDGKSYELYWNNISYTWICDMEVASGYIERLAMDPSDIIVAVLKSAEAK